MRRKERPLLLLCGLPHAREVATATDAAVRPAAVSPGYAARTSGRWTLDSSVKEVLLEDCGGLSDMSLHDFLMKHFKKTFGVEDTSMRVFMDNPSLCISDEAVLRRIINSSPYRQYVEEYVRAYELYRTMREGVDRLRAMGIISLDQWESAAAANEVENVGVCVRGVLNAALLSARRNEETIRVGNAPGGEEVDGVYDAVYNARWSYVVMSSEYDKKWLGMGVLRVSEGEQPHLWSEEQADAPYDPEEPWEGDVVPGVSGKLVMAVLSSQKGWPYTLFNASASEMASADVLRKYKDVHNAHLHIRKENVRVWHIIQKGLVEWLTGVKKVHPFIVIGTPGIGKSFATGSLLLYQLLHYKPEWLKVVAYFVREKAYIFHRKERRVVYYKKQQAAVDEIECMEKRGTVGYIIFDISGNSVIIGRLPDNWGIVLISSPNVKNFHEFAKQRQDTASIYMNCYEDAEFKAALVWDRHLRVAHNQIKLENANLGSDWEQLK
ncbi:unnamed protein product [Trypanosoma congolense IL3000]|uniref:WGS project CAEQ00000000 data, annotated contig 187 n=1 Tax=Trypanosoma congolense (strain IL3000) TaxID=1068625 RepID=F9W9L0_TRYCI|nr:unnamed protein product [Trypanosoma congolense IL3000]